MKPQISVIIPAYNEQANFKRVTLSHVYDYLKGKFSSFELIFVNDGSTDATKELLNQFKLNKDEVIIINNTHQGKANTVKTGMLQAKGEYRLFTDFDQSTPIQEVEKMLPFFNRGYDVVIGSREVEGAIRDKEPWYRHIMGKGFNFGVQLVAVHGIHDTQCGFKIMTDRATKSLFPRLRATINPSREAFTGAFDVELLFLARKLGFRIAEVPVKWFHVESKRVSPIRDSFKMAWQVILIRWMYFLGKYA